MTAGTSLLSRGAGFASFVAIVPLTVRHLGSEKYGIWMTALSLVAFLSLANLGMGNALITLIARADAASDETEVAELVSTAVTYLSGVALVMGGVVSVAFSHVPWAAIFNVSSTGPLAADARHAAAAVIAVYLIGIPAGLVVQIRLGYQEGFISAWWDAGASVVTVIAVAACVSVGSSFTMLVGVAAAVPLLGDLGNFLFLGRRRPELRPRLRSVTTRKGGVLLRTGGLFFVLQIAVLLAYTSDNIVTAQVIGPSAVTQYAVPARLALAGVALVTAFLSPLWPAYADALARRDTGWARSTLRRSLALSTATALIGAVVFIAAGRFVVTTWSRGAVHPSYGLLVGLACWIVLSTAGAAMAMFLNAAHVVGLQVVCSISMAVVNVLLSVLLASRIGVAGVIWGTVISYALLIALPYVLLVPRIARDLFKEPATSLAHAGLAKEHAVDL